MIDTGSFTLDNGLRVVHHLDASTPMMAVNVLYNVGAKDENPEHTGMAHLFEHLMFGGSANIADFDRAIELAGGWNNAWTTNDYTNFYDVLPAANAETAFWAESDRMLALAFSDKAIEVQRQVVVEEFKQTCLNRPYGDIGHLLRGLIYKVHPYRWPTIGLTPDHILGVCQDDVRDFFYSHYAPNNAVLAVAGNISFEHTRELAQKWFGNIPPREIAPRTYSMEPAATEPRRLEVTRDVPSTCIAIAYPMMPYGHPLYEAADILTDILSTGTSSRFQLELVAKGNILTEADASILGSDDPGYMLVTGRLADNSAATLEMAETALHEQLDRIASGGVSADELKRAVNKFESNLVFNNIGFLARAQAIAMSTIHSEDINDILPRYNRLTPDNITAAAREIIRPEACRTLIYKSEH